jgi:hypothetical protein
LRTSLLLFFLFTGLSSGLVAQGKTDSLLIRNFQRRVQILSADSMYGRPACSKYEKQAATFIADEFMIQGLKPKKHIFSFRCPDSTTKNKSVNVYCFINNGADSTIIIGAHYDHIGMGGPLSLNMGKKGIHNGADDNASGVALLIELSNSKMVIENKNFNFVLVAYSAHEIGLYGSGSFAEFSKKKFKPVSMVINFDMVGRMHPDLKWLKVIGVQSQNFDKAYFKKPNGLVNFRIETDTLLNQLDTRKYHKFGWPCISFTTGIHDDYHKMTDDENKLNYQGMVLIYRVIEDFFLLLQ